MKQNFVWLAVRCTACGWRGQKPTINGNQTATVTCPECGHTGRVAVPTPPAREWPPAGVRQIASVWPGKTPPADWRGPYWEAQGGAAWAS